MITLFGDNAALPHASASPDRKLKEDEFALFDGGGSLFGYEVRASILTIESRPHSSPRTQSDFTRTMLPDPPASRLPRNRKWPSARAERVWTTVHRAQQAALDALLTPNESSVVYAADVDRAARGVIEREGWGQYFTHRLGHGARLLLLPMEVCTGLR